MFTREALLGSDWYKARLLIKQEREVELWTRHVTELENFINRLGYAAEARRLRINERLECARIELERVASAAYLDELQGTLGADPILAENAPRALAGSTRSSGDARPAFN